MTTRELEIFSAVAEQGTMSEAARKLRISQSSVSQAVADIEREYGVLLFERYAHSLHLTHTGRTLLEYARQTLHLARETDAFLRSATRQTELRVGASATVGSCVLCPLLDRLQTATPGLRPWVVVSNSQEIQRLLLHNELDVGLVEGRTSHPDLVVRRAMEDELVLICGRNHPFFGRELLQPEELEGQTLILREEGSGTRAHWEDQLRRCGVTGVPGWVCTSPEAIRAAVIHGFGLSVLSRRQVREDLAAGRLWICPVEGLELRRSFSLVYHKNKYASDLFSRFCQVALEMGSEETRSGQLI